MSLFLQYFTLLFHRFMFQFSCVAFMFLPIVFIVHYKPLMNYYLYVTTSYRTHSFVASSRPCAVWVILLGHFITHARFAGAENIYSSCSTVYCELRYFVLRKQRRKQGEIHPCVIKFLSHDSLYWQLAQWTPRILQQLQVRVSSRILCLEVKQFMFFSLQLSRIPCIFNSIFINHQQNAVTK